MRKERTSRGGRYQDWVLVSVKCKFRWKTPNNYCSINQLKNWRQKYENTKYPFIPSIGFQSSSQWLKSGFKDKELGFFWLKSHDLANFEILSDTFGFYGKIFKFCEIWNMTAKIWFLFIYSLLFSNNMQFCKSCDCVTKSSEFCQNLWFGAKKSWFSELWNFTTKLQFGAIFDFCIFLWVLQNFHNLASLSCSCNSHNFAICDLTGCKVTAMRHKVLILILKKFECLMYKMKKVILKSQFNVKKL